MASLFRLARPWFVAVILFFIFFIPCARSKDVGMIGASAENPLPGELSELWEGALYTSTYRVGVCISANGVVRGALFLRRADTQIDEYHFSGTVSNNHIEAQHSSGHKFSGRLVSHNRVEGRITLKNGMRLFLEGKRIQDALLNYADCSPLPEAEK